MRDLSDQILAIIVAAAGLDLEGEPSVRGIEGCRQEIIGMEIADRCEDVRHLRMKERVVFQLWNPMPKQLQPAQRVYCVHLTLQRKMSVKPIKQHGGLIDNAGTLPCGQRWRFGKESSDRNGCLQERAYDFVRFASGGC